MIEGHSGTTLTDAMLQWYGIDASADPPLVLNPAFVEAILGLPEDWTNVDDETAYACWETPSPQLRLF